MKWYVLTLFLVVGFVWSASAQQQVDPNLVGNWPAIPAEPSSLVITKSAALAFRKPR
jgi:hypothetical protein